ncbi:MAG: fibrobacter succinogenes major paralogous domain-containing protein [Fidelibacterota bacterium]|nr:MAG: fibrobacter succinogenes major paralogous domain-containing protein [Candidatus Neomarinimicrobiota bacterium]
MRLVQRSIPAALGVALLAIVPPGTHGRVIAGSQPAYHQAQSDTVIDIDGNVYHTVAIGSQLWLVENLRVTHYRDGTAIPEVSVSNDWSSLTTGAFCEPEPDSSAGREAYGLLYNFHAVNDSRELCPEGWHVPTAEEWRTLIETLGGDEEAGGSMRDTGSGLWRTPVPGSTNASGFSALPAGGRGRFGGAGEVGRYATWWSSTPHDDSFAWHWGLHPDRNSIRYNPGHKASGFSVRCIKD